MLFFLEKFKIPRDVAKLMGFLTLESNETKNMFLRFHTFLKSEIPFHAISSLINMLSGANYGSNALEAKNLHGVCPLSPIESLTWRFT